MKKIFKKLTATVLTAALLTSITHTPKIHALPPTPPSIFIKSLPMPYSNEEIIRRIDEKIHEFESFAPDIFFIDPDFKDPAKTDLRISYQIIAQMTQIFKKFPYIRNMFVKQVKEIPETHRFELKLLTEELQQQIKKVHNMDSKITIPAMYATSDMMRLFMNVNMLNQVATDPLSHKKAKKQIVIINDDYTPCATTHEIGHLVFNVIVSHKYPEIFSEYINAVKKLHEDMLQGRTINYSDPTYQESSLINMAMATIHSNIKRIIVKIAKDKYGYTDDKPISEYAKSNVYDWLAEVFVDAVCNDHPTPIGMAMLEYLENFDEYLSKI